jgi:membrane-associated phospholipid phosphatase
MKHEKQKEITFWAFFTLEALILLGLFIGSFAFFSYLSYKVFLVNNQKLDQAVFRWAAALQTENFTRFMKFVTWFASARFFLTVPVALITFFLFFHNWRCFSGFILVSTAGATLFNQYLKNNFGRLRPVTAFYHQAGFSFPSGHAMIGGAFYGILIYLILTNVRNNRIRIPVCLALGFWQLLICFSRVYLNVHYATDVLAGLAAGIFWCGVVVVLVKQLQQFNHNLKRKRRLDELRELRSNRTD